jgi:DNA invertase Pin-like site-specific DNA recombinase
MQRRDLIQYCQQRGWTVYREYSDAGISGTRDRRPALDAMMNDARKRLFHVVVCWRFDRFARSPKHLLTALDEFRHLGIDFISYQENIDTSSPLGKAMFTIVAAIAELERNIIVERIKGGLRRAKALGRHIGRPALTTPQIIQQAVVLRQQGRSLREISHSIGVSRSLVHRWLKPAAPHSEKIS